MKRLPKITALLVVISGLLFVTDAIATENDSHDHANHNQQNQSADPALTQNVQENERVLPKGNPVELTAGHVDLGPLLVNGKWGLYARDDTSASPVWRNLDEIVFRVPDRTKQQIPQTEDYKFIKSDGKVWVIPQQELRGAVWLGWNTQSPKVIKEVNGGVDLIFSGHQGPGDFHVFIQAGNFAGPQQLWNSQNKKSQPIHVELNTHTHANWVFTKPGIHLVRVNVQAQLKNGEMVSETKILRFAVSDKADAQKALAEKWNTENTAESEVVDSRPNEINQNNMLPFIIGGSVGLILIITLAVIFVFRKRDEKAKIAGENLATNEPVVNETESVVNEIESLPKDLQK